MNSTNWNKLNRAPDAVTWEEFLPKLTPERRKWLESLPDEARDMVEQLLWQKGEEYFLSHWGHLQSQMEYVLTLL